MQPGDQKRPGEKREKRPTASSSPPPKRQKKEIPADKMQQRAPPTRQRPSRARRLPLIPADTFWEENEDQSPLLQYIISTSNDYGGQWNFSDGQKRQALCAIYTRYGKITFPSLDHWTRFIYDPRFNGRSGPSAFIEETRPIVEKHGGQIISERGEMAFPNRNKWLAYINDKDHKGRYNEVDYEIRTSLQGFRMMQAVLKNESADEKQVQFTFNMLKHNIGRIQRHSYFYVSLGLSEKQLIKVDSIDAESPKSIYVKFRNVLQALQNDTQVKEAFDQERKLIVQQSVQQKPILSITAIEPVGAEIRRRLMDHFKRSSVSTSSDQPMISSTGGARMYLMN